MNKEIMEIVEIKNEIEDLKKLNAEENEKINFSTPCINRG